MKEQEESGHEPGEVGDVFREIAGEPDVKGFSVKSGTGDLLMGGKAKCDVIM